MKQVYVPTMDELYLIQDEVTGYNLYKYLLVKVIESLIMEGINLPNKGILKNAYKYLRENPEIAYAVCRLYPEEIKYSEYARNDIDLCEELITNEDLQSKTIYNLDNLHHFENGLGVLSNREILINSAKLLSRELPKNPRYRFEYKENILLDNIFSCNIERQDVLGRQCVHFLNIDPAYTIKFDEEQLITHISPYQNRSKLLERSINTYLERYGVAGIIESYQYKDKDILTNPDTEVKKLLKCIDEHQRRFK